MDLVKLFDKAAKRAGFTVHKLDRNLPVHGIPPGLPPDVAKRLRDRAKPGGNGAKK